MKLSMKHGWKKRIVLLVLVLVVCMITACVREEENTTQKDGTDLLGEENLGLIHEKTDELLRDTATAGGVWAELTDLQPFVLYISTENGEVTQLYDVYRATYTSRTDVHTERYLVAYYRDIELQEQGGEKIMKLGEPIPIGQIVEVSMTAEDGGHVIGYKSQPEMEKDVLESQETNITHQIQF